MRGAVATVLVALFALPASAQAAEAPFVDWTSLLPGVNGDFQPSRERDCVSGKAACVESTLDEMYRRFDRLYSSCDHNAAFGITYIRVTEAIRAKMLQRPPFYQEPRFLQHVDKVFARMYFRAYDAWRSGRRERVPLAWREAFDTGRDRSVSGIGNLLMSMNAHINRDFPYLVEALGMNKPDGTTRKVDHDRGNRVLHPLYDDVLRELAARFDRTILNYDVPGLYADDVALFQILQGWREGVWRNAELLRGARTPAQRRLVSNTIEQYALTQARLIRANTTIRSSAARDAQCAEYRRTHRERGAGRRRSPAPRRLRASRRGWSGCACAASAASATAMASCAWPTAAARPSPAASGWRWPGAARACTRCAWAAATGLRCGAAPACACGPSRARARPGARCAPRPA